MLPLMNGMLPKQVTQKSMLPLMEMVGNRLWKRYATALWKRYVTALCNQVSYPRQ